MNDGGSQAQVRPEPVWRQARTIALGILIAAAVLFVVWQMASHVNDVDCITQRSEVLKGERASVDPACVGR